MMNQIPINTSQNVNIMFALASVGERIFAFIIDMLIKTAYISAIAFLFEDVLSSMNGHVEEWVVVVFILLIMSPVWFYTIASEMLMEGQTFGKKLMKIKVVKIDGYQASLGDYFIRWVMALVDIYVTSGVVGLLAIMFSQNNQRLGGMISGTAVISLKNQVNITHTILENITQEYQPTFPQVVAFSDNDIRIIKEHYQKADALNDKQVLEKLVQKIEDILRIKKANETTPRQFIRAIIKDYNYYTGQDF